MTLAGTRPILPGELEQYELHHRTRIAIKPGITGMWQVSGDYYYKYVNGTYKLVARAEKDYGNRSYDEKPEQIIYTVKGQEVTKAEYSAYTKKIIKNESGKSFSKLKWKRY